MSGSGRALEDCCHIALDARGRVVSCELARDVEGAWSKLEKLIEASDYDVAVKLAIDLRDLMGGREAGSSRRAG